MPAIGSPERLPPRTQPRLALVLGSGGGARSAAAIGIADVLARSGLRPDLLVGCSVGAIFAATVALGLSSGMSLRLAAKLRAQELTERQCWPLCLQRVAPRWTGCDARFSRRGERLMAERLHAIFGDVKLEDLRTPLRIAATDAATGDAVTLSHGPLAVAIQASLSMPLLRPAVAVEGRLMLGGAMSDPLPVAAAADTDVVVALGFRGTLPRSVKCLSQREAQVSTALVNNLFDARLAAARARGARLIELELELPSDNVPWDTPALSQALEAGVRSARAALPAIERAMVARAPVLRAV